MSETASPARPLRVLLLAAITLAVCALAYLALLLVTTDAPPAPAATAQPVTASPALRAEDVEGLVSMVNQYPGALLAAKEGAGLTLLGAESHDTAWRDGWARVAEAVYADEEGRQLRLFSFYPADAAALLDTEGWTLSASPGPSVSGCETLLASSGSLTRLLLTYGAGAYAVEIPSGMDIRAAALPLQLYSKQTN